MTQSTLQLLLPGADWRAASMAKNPSPGPSGAASLPPVPGATSAENRSDKGGAFSDLLRQQHPELAPPSAARAGKNLPQEGRSLPPPAAQAQAGIAEAVGRTAEPVGPDARVDVLHPVWQGEASEQRPLPFNAHDPDWQRPGWTVMSSLQAHASTPDSAEQVRVETTPPSPLLEASAGQAGAAELLQGKPVSRAGGEMVPPQSGMTVESTDHAASPANKSVTASANGLSQEQRGQESLRPLQRVTNIPEPAQPNLADNALRTDMQGQPGSVRPATVDTGVRMQQGIMTGSVGSGATETQAAQQAANPTESGFRPAVGADQAVQAALKESLTPTTLQAAMDATRSVPVTNSVPVSSRDRAADWRESRLERPGLMAQHNPETPPRPLPVADTPVGDRLQRFIEQFSAAMSERNGAAATEGGSRESREAPNPATIARGEAAANANLTAQSASAQAIQGQAQTMAGQMQPGTALPGTLRSEGASDWMSAERSLAGTTAREQWGEKLGQRIAMMVAGNHSQARIQLDPPELGSLMIQLQLKGEQATVNFASPHGMVREALEGSISRLQDMLAEQGVDLLDVNVSDQSPGEQPGDTDTGQHGTPGGEDGDSELTTELPTLRSDALIDYYV